MTPTLRAALTAANRILHGDGDQNDAQLVAGVLIELANTPTIVIEHPADTPPERTATATGTPPHSARRSL